MGKKMGNEIVKELERDGWNDFVGILNMREQQWKELKQSTTIIRLLEVELNKRFDIEVFGRTYEVRDQLKQRGMQWDGAGWVMRGFGTFKEAKHFAEKLAKVIDKSKLYFSLDVSRD